MSKDYIEYLAFTTFTDTGVCSCSNSNISGSLQFKHQDGTVNLKPQDAPMFLNTTITVDSSNIANDFSGVAVPGFCGDYKFDVSGTLPNWAT